MQKPGWERVVTSDGYAPLLFYLILCVTTIFGTVFFIHLLAALRFLVLPAH